MSKDTVRILTVKEYMTEFNLSKPTVYTYIKSGKVDSYLEGKNRLIRVKQTSKEVSQPVSKEVNNTVNQTEQINFLKATIERQNEEIKELYNRIIKIEQDQKQEIKDINKVKDDRLQQFMLLIKEQTENLITKKAEQEQHFEAEIVEEEQAEQEYLSLNEFVEYIKNKKGYSDKKIYKILNRQLKEKDPRFIDTEDGFKIIKNKFKDL